MAAPAHAPPAATGSPGIETLKALKHAEVDSESKLKAFLDEGSRMLSQLKTDAEAAVHATRLEVDKLREKALQDARSRAEAESAQILSDGEAAARSIASATGKDLAAVKDKILDLVVGEFRKNGKGPEA